MWARRLAAIVALLAAGAAPAADLLVEAEGFAEHGGWAHDPQYVSQIGSPYLLAHGLGRPVANARTTVRFDEGGEYRVWVRAKDWVPSHHPGRFGVLVNSVALDTEFGANGKDWSWQCGGTVKVAPGEATVELKDLTGFDGRCDAVYFTTDAAFVPPQKADEQMAAWRRRLLRLPATPPSGGTFDCVVVGGGLAGCSAALTAARLGLTVALIQDRPVLGGNASSEIGLPPRGEKRSIVEEVAGRNRARVIQAEKRITLLLGWHAYGVQKQGNRIAALDARNTRTNEERRFTAPVYIDCTGDGWIGYWAGAEFRMGREAAAEFDESLAPAVADKITHGITVQFGTRRATQPWAFPDVPWAAEVARNNTDLSGHYGWECGQHRDVIGEAEDIRDYAFRAIYGSFANVKRADPEKNANLELWVRHVVAGNESRRLMGDHILTQKEIQSQGPFDDAVATGGAFFCRHTPDDRRGFGMKFHLTGVKPYPIPFRCLYSKNVENLMMAGRCISASHVGFCSIKLMKTGGQTGVAVGAAACLCKKHATTPRGLYQKHLAELQDVVFERGSYEGALRTSDSQTPR